MYCYKPQHNLLDLMHYGTSLSRYAIHISYISFLAIFKLTEFYILPDTKYIISETFFPANLLA